MLEIQQQIQIMTNLLDQLIPSEVNTITAINCEYSYFHRLVVVSSFSGEKKPVTGLFFVVATFDFHLARERPTDKSNYWATLAGKKNPHMHVSAYFVF